MTQRATSKPPSAAPEFVSAAVYSPPKACAPAEDMTTFGGLRFGRVDASSELDAISLRGRLLGHTGRLGCQRVMLEREQRRDLLRRKWSGEVVALSEFAT